MPPTMTPSPSDPHVLLLSNRFKITTKWTKKNGETGPGTAIKFATPDTGAFWFFGPNNYEVMVKTLNGCGVNQKWWVFAGGLTNVKVEMTVIDTQTGASKVYVNPQSTAFQPIQDTGAFPCP